MEIDKILKAHDDDIDTSIIFSVDEFGYPHILCHANDLDKTSFPKDISEIENNTFQDAPAIGVYKGSVYFVDIPEAESDGYWQLSDDFELLYEVEGI